jgi:hypothetical protein
VLQPLERKGRGTGSGASNQEISAHEFAESRWHSQFFALRFVDIGLGIGTFFDDDIF